MAPTLKYVVIPVMIIMAGILFSCENDMETIELVTLSDDSPDEVTSNMEMLYTDSGYAQVRIRATIAESYSKPERITKLKDGLEVEFYSNNGEVVSILTALYGEVNFKTNIMLVRDSVVLRNVAKDQTLNTEELFYNQTDSTIYSDRNVFLTRHGKVGRGDGIRTTQEFTYYKVINPVGEAAFSDEESPESKKFD